MEIKVDDESLAELQSTIKNFKSGGRLVLVRATNDTAKGIRTKAAQLIGSKATLSAADIKVAFQVTKMSVNALSSRIECIGEPIPLIKFSQPRGPGQTNKGASVKLLRSNKKEAIPHAFIATMKSGHRGIFWRKSKKRGPHFSVRKRITLPSPVAPRGGPYEGLAEFQLPIKQLYGPRIPDFFDDPDIMGPTMQEANVRFQARLTHHTNRLIEANR